MILCMHVYVCVYGCVFSARNLKNFMKIIDIFLFLTRMKFKWVIAKNGGKGDKLLKKK